ncbi:DUF484 family protein [Salinivibrio sp. ES.052]|uniref:DUF484 family protein n=1 Tax=Salinivibrio sp. ES.052 TaxID=1882823 RepID=UPI00092C3109|nr:DUF484 family protein [Salinivibrio sp. ES.052]SIO23669.1 hypothetical protein SAMN05444724_2313 [Salinivibrio sp. ES.052]
MNNGVEATMLETMPLSEEAVAAYLKENPDFFVRQRDLLTQLTVPHGEQGAVSLVEIQLKRLRERVTELEEDITQLMSLGAKNDALFRAFSDAHQALLRAVDPLAVHQALRTLSEQLQLKVSVCVFSQIDGMTTIQRQVVEQLKSHHFAGRRCYLGRLRRVDAEVVMAQPPELGSFALVPIKGEGKEWGLLSFASADGGHFQPEMDTLFLEQLASHLAILCSQWAQKADSQ